MTLARGPKCYRTETQDFKAVKDAEEAASWEWLLLDVHFRAIKKKDSQGKYTSMCHLHFTPSFF